MSIQVQNKSISSLTTYENHKIANSAQVIVPEQMTLQVSNHFDSSYEYELIIEQIKEDLLMNKLNISASVKLNQENLQTCQNIVSKLPKMIEIQRQKLIIPEFDEIEVFKTDSSEIKKFIRKVNYEMLGFSCNHHSFDKKYEMVIKRVSDLFESTDYKIFESFLKTICSCVWQIRDKDSRNKTWVSEILPTGSEIKYVIDAMVKVNGNIASINSDANIKCSKCKAAIRKYEYSIREIQRMRDELNEQKQINEEYIEKPAEEKFDMKEFLIKNYPTIDRFELSDVKEKYKKTFGKVVKYDDLIKLVEETKQFKVTRSHNIKWVNRL